MARQGEIVVAVARRKELLDSLVEEISQAGGQAIAIVCDVTDRPSVLAAVVEAETLVGPIDRMIACAGGGTPTSVANFNAAHFDEVFAMNVGGTVHCIEAVLPNMLSRGSGQIVAISSLAAYRGLPGAAAYSAAKAALTNLIESLRIDLRPRGIAVTLLAPGFVRTRPSATAKRKPFQLELQKATAAMCRAIVSRKRFYAFPWPLAGIAAAGRLMPAALYDWLLTGKGARGEQLN
jgi:short-subunit dehydrogenase